MDRVTRNKFRNVTLENRIARRFFTQLADIYQTHPKLRFLTLKDLTGKMNVDLSVRYDGIATSGSSTSNIGFRVGLNFPIGG